MSAFTQKYGSTALVAGASEGLGRAFATYLAQQGCNLHLIARREGPLLEVAHTLTQQYNVQVFTHILDLSDAQAVESWCTQPHFPAVDVLVYNAALPHIGPFAQKSFTHFEHMMQVNCTSSLRIIHRVAAHMMQQKKGAVIILSSIAGLQGSPFLTTYAATKAFNRIFAEGLWYELKQYKIDVINCCAGATDTPNYQSSKPVKKVFFAPPVQSPMWVVRGTFKQLGKKPTYIPGWQNQWASWFMSRVLSRKMAVETMAKNTIAMYGNAEWP